MVLATIDDHRLSSAQATYVYVAASTGIPACSLAITRRLCKIVYLKRIFNEQHVSCISHYLCTNNLSEKRYYEISIDLFICLGLPLISLPLCKSDHIG